ncbi:hypothetical protein EW146_g4187 [Bondarzewia mesenterica]|uniref:Uncharacterized protein n=1 Tax=Bondarzewia mesenterica TaxID=1095465 RepID=A0A4S4LWD4_9AGAM|nr:hypothetical protein EW146_g4187 [Bondarzewia mesenterica]
MDSSSLRREAGENAPRPPKPLKNQPAVGPSPSPIHTRSSTARRANQPTPPPALHKVTSTTRTLRKSKFASKSEVNTEADDEEDLAAILEELRATTSGYFRDGLHTHKKMVSHRGRRAQDPDTATDNETIETPSESVIDVNSGRKYIIGAKLVAHGEPITLDSVSTSLLLFAEMLYKQILKNNVKPIRDSLRAFAMVLRGLDDDICTEKLVKSLADATAGTQSTTNPSDIQNSIFIALAAQESRLDKKFAELAMKLQPSNPPPPLHSRQDAHRRLGQAQGVSPVQARARQHAHIAAKACQILLEATEPTDPPLLDGRSLDSIRESANKVISVIAENPQSDPGFQVSIRQATRIRTGDLLLELNSADSAEWLSSWGQKFSAKLGKDIRLRHRLFPVLVKFMPLSF